MKKIATIVIGVICLALSGCSSNEYEGYWCNYNETSTIIVLLEKENTESQRKAIEEKINSFSNIAEEPKFYTREQYAADMGENVENIDIYDTYVISFNSMDSIGTYVEELGKMSGVKESKQSYAKTNISLYYLGDNKKYTYTNSDEANENDLIKGKYKIKKGAITFKPNKEAQTTNMLYIKDGFLCGDAACTEIYTKTDETCKSLQK